MFTRAYSLTDTFIHHIDQAMRTVMGKPLTTERPNPANSIQEATLSNSEKKHVAGLMRINHVGEVCAQALYQGQALTAKCPEVRQNMERAAMEENDHLDWCEQRTQQLGGHKSYLSPLWYAGSFSLGAIAGLAGDKWSLGFVAETEKQVVQHLEEHLQQLPQQDAKTRAVLEQMKTDEQAHAANAISNGGVDLPLPIKLAMQASAKVMTVTAYHV